MASTHTANVVEISDTLVKLYFIDYNAPLLDGLETVTIDGEDYNVVSSSIKQSYLIIEAGDVDFNSREDVTANFPSGGEPSLGYGLLYNWYAATDARGIAPDGWRVASQSDFNTLISSIGGSSDAGTKIKSQRQLPSISIDPYWEAPAAPPFDPGNVADPNSNTSEFNGLPAGIRGTDGSYINIRSDLVFHTTTDIGNIFRFFASNSTNTFVSYTIPSSNKVSGLSIRCLRDTEPPSPTVTDADGNIYTWVQIGSQYWLQQSLKTTKYNNGEDIPTGLDNTEWANTTAGAWAYPNGDSNLPI